MKPLKDLALPKDEAIRIYGMRWSIETFLKASKSLLKLSEEFQARNYDASVLKPRCFHTLYHFGVASSEGKRPKNLRCLFFALCENVQDMELTEALKSLMALFVDIINDWSAENSETIKCQLTNWITSPSRYIKELFPNLGWES